MAAYAVFIYFYLQMGNYKWQMAKFGLPNNRAL